MYKVYGNVLSTGTKERTKEVLGGFGHKRLCVCVCGNVVFFCYCQRNCFHMRIVFGGEYFPNRIENPCRFGRNYYAFQFTLKDVPFCLITPHHIQRCHMKLFIIKKAWYIYLITNVFSNK